MDSDNVKKILELGEGLRGAQSVIPDGTKVPVHVLPAGYTLAIPPLASVEPWLNRPLRKKGNWHFGTAESFIRYFNEHKTPESRIFTKASLAGAEFRGVLNFHSLNDAAWNDHVAFFKMRTTPEWDAFISRNNVECSQSEFAEFLEENAALFVEPTGAALLELVTRLEATSHAHFESATKLQNKTVKFAFKEDVVLKAVVGTKDGDMELPALLKLGLAPFEGTASYGVEARLKYALKDRKLTLWYQGINLHLLVKQVVQDTVNCVWQQTGVEPFIE